MTENLPVRKSKAKQVVLISVAVLLVFGLLAYFISVFRSNIKSSLSVSVDKSEAVVDPMNEMEIPKESVPFAESSGEQVVEVVEDNEVIDTPREYEQLFPPFINPTRPSSFPVSIISIDYELHYISLGFIGQSYIKKYRFDELQVLRFSSQEDKYSTSQFIPSDVGKHAYFDANYGQRIIIVAISEENLE